MSLRRFLLASSLAVLLGACASTPPAATVQVFTPSVQWPAGSTYRFDRLPSQAVQTAQPELEAAAQALLEQAGLRRDDAAPRLSVQLAMNEDAGSAPVGLWGGPSVGVSIGGGSRGSGVGIGLGIPIGGSGAVQPSRRVEVLLRDLSSGQVVFQSQASGGPGARAASLVRAALADFPSASPGVRQVPLAD
jgi:hypothetical protein